MLANDGRLLSKLPPHIALRYPVDPQYADSGSSFQLSRCTSQLLENYMLTTSSGEQFSQMLYKRQATLYENVELEYYGRGVYLKRNNLPRLPSFESFYNRIYPPSGDDLRKLYNRAGRSTITLGGLPSSMDRYPREIQMVGCRLSISTDHTFATLKNYSREIRQGADAVVGASTDTTEIVFACIVPTTGAADMAHATEQFARRQNVRPQQISTDTWPCNESFYKLIFGDHITGRLGLWHYINRITRTLRSSHSDYYQSIKELQACVYQVLPEDEEKLMKALKSGEMGNKVYTDGEIADMRCTKRWSNNYASYLRKRIFGATHISYSLGRWFIKYKVHASEGEEAGRGRPDPKSGLTLFTPETKPAYVEALKKGQYVSDMFPTEDLYMPILPSKGTRHNLIAYRSLRGTESYLESFHDSQANFANTGMKTDHADFINHAGLAHYNCQARWRIEVDQMVADERAKIPYSFRKVPKHWNHSKLALVNRYAKLCCKLEPPPHDNVRILQKDSGERFYAEYYFEQMKRNQTIESHPDNDRCQCKLCAGRGPIIFNPYKCRAQGTPPTDERTTASPDAGSDYPGATTATATIMTLDSNSSTGFARRNPAVILPLQPPTCQNPSSAAIWQPQPMTVASQTLPLAFFPSESGRRGAWVITAAAPLPPSTNAGQQEELMLPTCAGLNSGRFSTAVAQQHHGTKRKLQTEYCCSDNEWYHRIAKLQRISKAGRPPHAIDCTRRKASAKQREETIQCNRKTST